MTLESKLRKAAVMTAVDISLKRVGKSPERCARNLLELGISAYPGQLLKKEQDDFLSTLMSICKENDTQQARSLFIHTFLSDSQ